MRLLVLGGTKFLGRALVEAALARGHDVSIFTRGRTNPDLFPEVERLRGDRDGDLRALEGGRWDAAVDTSGFVPRVVRASAELLRKAVGHYTFVSSGSVYADHSRRNVESSALAELEDPASEDVETDYGALKAACERIVAEVYGERALVVRAGLIVGPHDPTGRFTYWPVRVARGGDVLAPEPRDARVQLIDVRDLAEWIVRMAEAGRGGVYNAVGPEPRPTLEELLETCRAVANPSARFVWVGEAFLVERGVAEWMELPLWIAAPEYGAFMDVDVSRAVAAGLTFRPLAETVRATLEWARTDERDGLREDAGLAPEREAELLEEWRART
jgi:2'-hydroxyisoflavone reductase